jgi:hypothetical protein
MAGMVRLGRSHDLPRRASCPGRQDQGLRTLRSRARAHARASTAAAKRSCADCRVTSRRSPISCHTRRRDYRPGWRARPCPLPLPPLHRRLRRQLPVPLRELSRHPTPLARSRGLLRVVEDRQLRVPATCDGTNIDLDEGKLDLGTGSFGLNYTKCRRTSGS